MRRLALFTILLAVGCSKKDKSGGPSIAEVQDALKSAGLKVDNPRAVPVAQFSASECSGAAVEGLDEVVCRYGSVEALALGKKAAESYLGESTTGVVLDGGKTLFVLADRGRVDPNGKIINKASKAFRGLSK